MIQRFQVGIPRVYHESNDRFVSKNLIVVMNYLHCRKNVPLAAHCTYTYVGILDAGGMHGHQKCTLFEKGGKTHVRMRL